MHHTRHKLQLKTDNFCEETTLQANQTNGFPQLQPQPCLSHGLGPLPALATAHTRVPACRDGATSPKPITAPASLRKAAKPPEGSRAPAALLRSERGQQSPTAPCNHRGVIGAPGMRQLSYHPHGLLTNPSPDSQLSCSFQTCKGEENTTK